ncbi:MAG TPA: hypothetical protein VJS64_18495 [Pyrinomonadaceae bacterium]|nr:hypothetical protein [Pyrinomonadaceae bacterium]
MKRTRRIEVIRYRRQVTLRANESAPDRAEVFADDIVLEALGGQAAAGERETAVVTSPRPPLLRRLLKLARVRTLLSRSLNNKRHKENQS